MHKARHQMALHTAVASFDCAARAPFMVSGNRCHHSSTCGLQGLCSFPNPRMGTGFGAFSSSTTSVLSNAQHRAPSGLPGGRLSPPHTQHKECMWPLMWLLHNKQPSPNHLARSKATCSARTGLCTLKCIPDQQGVGDGLLPAEQGPDGVAFMTTTAVLCLSDS